MYKKKKDISTKVQPHNSVQIFASKINNLSCKWDSCTVRDCLSMDQRVKVKVQYKIRGETERFATENSSQRNISTKTQFLHFKVRDRVKESLIITPFNDWKDTDIMTTLSFTCWQTHNSAAFGICWRQRGDNGQLYFWKKDNVTFHSMSLINPMLTFHHIKIL